VNRDYLKCTTNRPGEPCIYMKKDGCMVLTGCQSVVEECAGCRHARQDGYCEITPWPVSKWDKEWPCNYATHVKKEGPGPGAKKLNPLKASKRQKRGQE